MARLTNSQRRQVAAQLISTTQARTVPDLLSSAGRGLEPPITEWHIRHILRQATGCSSLKVLLGHFGEDQAQLAREKIAREFHCKQPPAGDDIAPSEGLLTAVFGELGAAMVESVAQKSGRTVAELLRDMLLAEVSRQGARS